MANILIIEDNEATRLVCKALLGQEHQILEATNSDDGLRLLREVRPDIVITDLIVPNSKGIVPHQNSALDLISSIKQVNESVMIVIYSGLCFESKITKQAIALGANACLAKDGSGDNFKKTIHNLLNLLKS